MEAAKAYVVRLLYRSRPTLRKSAILAKLENYAPDFTPLDGDRDEGLLAFVRSEPLFEKAQWIATPAPFDEATCDEAWTEGLEQSWNWPEARDVAAECKFEIQVADVRALDLPAARRLRMIQQVVAAILHSAPCDAIYWTASRSFVSPAEFLAAVDSLEEHPWLAPGAIHIRQFRVVEYEDGADANLQDALLDSVGLNTLGLPDVQCHFRGIDAQLIVPLLYRAACTLFETGRVAAGDAVAGIRPGQFWRHRGEKSLAPPLRTVVDIAPSGGHKAGVRD
ncbi:DUF4261 domain-containing protein [Blastopirellula sp. JC732]|uniref:DUF4261 domain-containing protein n=1 Tax=Blastopirellula sediminis TaxID=2894196 RepID=A0A9X1SG13_9BACT|nr:DUF4261 domain-containing protein [Blastopirellula sediminis]MCC9607011.1 DUF4261 domain-containing protein [Blastopirellula sediminis]MCC9629695.1 DUF4261 domain-containing protein [Blastopirellula sediminis]